MGKPKSNPVKVLLVSDLPIVAMGLQWFVANHSEDLAIAGFARNLPDALCLLDKEPADVILLDLDGDNGVETVPDLFAACKSRVLVLSSSRDLELQDAAVIAGASGMVSKREPVELMLKAILKVNAGELWVDRSATVRILMSIARSKATPNPDQEKITLLTRKERLVVAELASDAATESQEIAGRLHISEHTLRNHLSSIFSKLGVRNRMELYAYAHKRGLNGRGNVTI